MTDVENKATANRLWCKSAKFITVSTAILKNGGRSNRSHRRTALKPICIWRTRTDRSRSSIFRVDQIGLSDLGQSGPSPTCNETSLSERSVVTVVRCKEL
ncbi:hypothetical protein OUZ56_018879 [Daphnia magna]|uniref:Uncharacterized protein n=1 Tax=Daphnia magna TaxID=35525 RepID=A0ABQ9ZA02_9CRUS|nr:hypothetical protein OUZ56_018879 [Daphnia magna]